MTGATSRHREETSGQQAIAHSDASSGEQPSLFIRAEPYAVGWRPAAGEVPDERVCDGFVHGAEAKPSAEGPVDACLSVSLPARLSDPQWDAHPSSDARG